MVSGLEESLQAFHIETRRTQAVGAKSHTTLTIIPETCLMTLQFLLLTVCQYSCDSCCIIDCSEVDGNTTCYYYSYYWRFLFKWLTSIVSKQVRLFLNGTIKIVHTAPEWLFTDLLQWRSLRLTVVQITSMSQCNGSGELVIGVADCYIRSNITT